MQPRCLINHFSPTVANDDDAVAAATAVVAAATAVVAAALTP